MVDLAVPYESRMEQAHTYKKEKYLDLTKELEESGYRAKIMPIEIRVRGFAGSSTYDLLSELSIRGNKRTKALKLLAETAETVPVGLGAGEMSSCFIRSKNTIIPGSSES
ncbi:polyprotein [Elysia marginata]|uniref:Polyprotein n=1 Tax=Elysia marginata TaxID=1093978 RepID=A0AAV4J557_9GAST|nr:polyprotein [Elysia marginata]